jgi:uncharacterized membrane protein YccF (DUF307 family)
MSPGAGDAEPDRALPMVARARTQKTVAARQLSYRPAAARPAHLRPPLALRLLYWLAAGWWLALIWSLAAWLASASIVGIPASVWMHNRVFSVLTLAPWTHNPRAPWLNPISAEPARHQRPLAGRIAYLVLVGWWLGALLTLAGWALSATLLGLPFGLVAFSYVPRATTLYRTS